MSNPARQLATFEDLAALPAHLRAELIDGTIVEKAAPSWDHGNAQGGLLVAVRGGFHGGGGAPGPGGWWILPEVDVRISIHNVYRPDLVGWHRERVPTPPRTRPVDIRPDWVCEILSPSNAATDIGDKLRNYHRAGVPHYWIVDPEHQTLTVYRFTPDGYLVVLAAGRAETVRAEPFDAIELALGTLFVERPDDAEQG